jgi:hypothetical protein
LLATALNMVDTLLPTSLTEPMITTAMREAKRAYSIAVAPDWSAQNRKIRFTEFPF